MTVPQTSLSRFPATEAFEGMLAFPDERSAYDIETKICAESAGLYFGKYVCRAGADNKCERPDSSGDVTGANGLGFVVRERQTFKTSDEASVAEKELAAVMRLGTIWALTEDLSAQGADVFVRFTTDLSAPDVDEDLGNVRSDADGGKAVALPGAKFRTTRANAGLCLVDYSRLHGPAGAVGPTGPTGPTA